jgi:hypothetical protein
MTRPLRLTQRSDEPANRAALAIAFSRGLTLSLLPLFGESSFAQDETSNVEPADDGTVDVRHEQWLERIAEAERRSHQLRWSMAEVQPLASSRSPTRSE